MTVDVDHQAASNPEEAVLRVLRSCCDSSVISRYDTVLTGAPVVAQALQRGNALVEAVRSAVAEVIELLPTVERQATRIMAGIEPGWEPSHGITRESRKNEMGLVLSRSAQDETAEGYTSRRVEQLERTKLGPAVTRLLFSPRPYREPSLRDRAIFAQFINPEFLALHDQTGLLKNPEATKRRLSYVTRMALMTSRVGLVLPGSYLFEVPGVTDYMDEVRELSEVGAIELTGPASGIDEYRDIKFPEYRDEADNPYSRTDPVETASGVNWRPRHGSSAAESITDSWVQEIRPGAMLDGVTRAIARAEGLTLRTAGRRLARVPEHMEGRALVPRYVFRAIQTPLPAKEQNAIRWLLSNKYLESYLDDLDASVLVDFDFGSFSATLGSGRRREISATRMSRIFKLLSLHDLLRRPTGRWEEVLALRESLELDVLLPVLYEDDGNTERLLRMATFRRGHQPPDVSKDTSGYITWLGELISAISDLLVGIRYY